MRENSRIIVKSTTAVFEGFLRLSVSGTTLAAGLVPQRPIFRNNALGKGQSPFCHQFLRNLSTLFQIELAGAQQRNLCDFEESITAGDKQIRQGRVFES